MYGCINCRWRHSSAYESDYTEPIEAYRGSFSKQTVTSETNLNSRRSSRGDIVSEGDHVSVVCDHSYCIDDHDNACSVVALPRYVMGYRFIKTPSSGRRHSTAAYGDLRSVEYITIPVNQSLPDLSQNSAVFHDVEDGLRTAKHAALVYRESREHERNRIPRDRRGSGPSLPAPRERRFIPRQSSGRRLPRYGLGSPRWDHSREVTQWPCLPLDTSSLQGHSVC